MKDLQGKIMIKDVRKSNPLSKPKVVYVKKWSEKNQWWVTPELNGNEFNFSKEESLIPFDYNTYKKLVLEYEVDTTKQKLTERKKELQELVNNTYDNKKSN